MLPHLVLGASVATAAESPLRDRLLRHQLLLRSLLPSPKLRPHLTDKPMTLVAPLCHRLSAQALPEHNTDKQLHRTTLASQQMPGFSILDTDQWLIRPYVPAPDSMQPSCELANERESYANAAEVLASFAASQFGTQTATTTSYSGNGPQHTAGDRPESARDAPSGSVSGSSHADPRSATMEQSTKPIVAFTPQIYLPLPACLGGSRQGARGG